MFFALANETDFIDRWRNSGPFGIRWPLTIVIESKPENAKAVPGAIF
jgi:hypothetical protein